MGGSASPDQRPICFVMLPYTPHQSFLVALALAFALALALVLFFPHPGGGMPPGWGKNKTNADAKAKAKAKAKATRKPSENLHPAATTKKRRTNNKHRKTQSVFQTIDLVETIRTVQKLSKSELSSQFLSRSKFENSLATFGRIQPIVPRFISKPFINRTFPGMFV